MDINGLLNITTEESARLFFRRAIDWYFGGYLKMDTERAPDPKQLITFLRVLGFRECKKEPLGIRSGRVPVKKSGYQVEINYGDPTRSVKLEFPDLTSTASPCLLDSAKTQPVFHDISIGRLKVVKEVFSMLMEFLLDKDGTFERNDKISEELQWRRCMSLSAMGVPTPQFSLPQKNSGDSKNIDPAYAEMPMQIAVDSGDVCIDEELKRSRTSNEVGDKQEEAMEVDIPTISNGTLANSNLSPIGGLARQKTWVLETSKSETKEFEKARTSTPMRANQTAKIGLNSAHGLSRVLRPRQARTEVQPQRLRSANAESVRVMTQLKNAKDLSARASNKSKNSSISSSSSVSSQSSFDVMRSNVSQKTSSKLLEPPLVFSKGAKPKLPMRSGVSQQASLSPTLSKSASAGATTHTRRLVSLPEMKKDGQMTTALYRQKNAEPQSLVKPKSRDPQQTNSDGEKMGVKRRPSLLPRFTSQKSTSK